MSDVSNSLDQSGAEAAPVAAAKPVNPSPATAAAKTVEAPPKAVAGSPVAAEQAAEAKPKKKPKPAGVTVYERAVSVDGKLVPMADRHQTPLAGDRKAEPVPAAASAT